MMLCTRLGFAAALLAVLSIWIVHSGSVDAAAKGTIPRPAQKDRCANVFSGSIPYDHGRYHWFCSGRQVIAGRKSATFSLQCGPGKFDKRRLYGYWVSSSAVRLTKTTWAQSFGELDLTFHDSSTKRQTFEYWESCLGST